MKIIAALGNPGKEYARTRHNAGFIAADLLSDHYNFESFRKEDRFEAEISTGVIDSNKCILVKPQTFMNSSGRAVQKVLAFYKLTPDDLIVIHDDLDIPVGCLRLSFDSRSAGHRGVQSIIDTLGSKEFWRLRLGIKVDDQKAPTERFVLSAFPKDEEEKLFAALAEVPETIEKELIAK